MELNAENYLTVKNACDQREDIEMMVQKDITAFSSSVAPLDWTQYPPSVLSNEDTSKLLACLSTDTSLKAALHRIEQAVYLQGAIIYYKDGGDDKTVLMRIEW